MHRSMFITPLSEYAPELPTAIRGSQLYRKKSERWPNKTHATAQEMAVLALAANSLPVREVAGWFRSARKRPV